MDMTPAVALPVAVPRDDALFPPAAAREIYQHQLTTLLADAERRVRQGPVAPRFDPAAFAEELAQFSFAQPLDLGDVAEWTVAQMEHGIVHVDHPRYLGLFNPAPSFPAQCAERIVAAFNPQLASATTSPAAVAIEAHVARAMALRLGLGPDAGGHFTSGGSEANYTALLCALTRAEPDFASRGSRAFAGPPRFYVSADSHLAWIKLAHMAGIGRDAIRLVRTGGDGRIDNAALHEVIATDRRAGGVPVMIAATAGTTNAGMVDDLPACAAAARQHGLWLHVDAAWGGAAAASPRYRHLLAGVELADSVTIDAHKWLATTMGCGMFLSRDPAVLTAAFSVAASFMPSQAPEADPYLATVQWSRRFLGLRLFLSLAAGGWQGYAAHVERAIDLAALFRRSMVGYGWTVENRSALAVTCLLPPAGSAPVRQIVARVVGSGEAWVSTASFQGRDVLRACVTNGTTTPADILAVAAVLNGRGALETIPKVYSGGRMAAILRSGAHVLVRSAPVLDDHHHPTHQSDF